MPDQKTDTPKSDTPKSDTPQKSDPAAAKEAIPERNFDAAPPQRDEFLAARKDDPSSAEVFKAAAVAADKADVEARKAAVAAGPGAESGPGGLAMVNEHGQVHQEGAHVEQPPQPATPPFTDEEIRLMDKTPAGLRELSVAAKSGDTDQTRHPKSRVDDPRTPL